MRGLRTIGLILFFLVGYFYIAQGVEAAILKFDQESISVNPDETFTVQVIVDPGSEQILATDAYVLYDPDLLEAQSVADGDYFNTVFNNITSGKVYVAGVVDDPATYKTGSGTVASITFKALKNGSGELTFYCDTSVSDTSKIIKNDVDATNIIDCDNNGSLPVVIGPGEEGGETPQPTPSSLPKSGVMDTIIKFGVPGSLFFLIGLGVKLLL